MWPSPPHTPPDPSPCMLGPQRCSWESLGLSGFQTSIHSTFSPLPVPRPLSCPLLSPWILSSSPRTLCLQVPHFQFPSLTELSWGVGALGTGRSCVFTGLPSHQYMEVRRKGKKEAETLRLRMKHNVQMANGALMVKYILFNTLISCLLEK